MYWKVVAARLLFIILIFVIAIGSLPMYSNMLSMQTMSMDAATTFHNETQGSTDANLDGSCCDGVSPFSMVCVFPAPQFPYVALSGGSEYFLILDPISKLIYLESLAPPPRA